MQTLDHPPQTPLGARARRRFLQSIAKSGLYAGVLLLAPRAAFGQALRERAGDKGLFKVADSVRNDPHFALNRSTFTPYLGWNFLVRGRLLTLVEVSPLAHPAAIAEATADERCFKLLFSEYMELARGHREQLLAQRTYLVTIPELGAFNIFLVPMGGDEARQFYEAVFNRLE